MKPSLTVAAETTVNAARALFDAATSDAAANAATIAAVVFAVVRVERWRVEKRDERRGEAAAHALGALLMFCDKLGDWMTMIETASRPIAGPPSENRDALVAETALLLRQARKEIETYREGLHEAARRARAYLLPLEIESLNAAYGIYSQVAFRLDTQPELRSAGGGLPQDRFSTCLAELRDAVERVRDRGEEKLRRIACHEDASLMARIRAWRRRGETLRKAFRL